LKEILSVNNLTKSFAGKTVVNNISFDLQRGNIMGLLGPNGAGKTTAIRIIMGILHADKGKVNFYFNGTNSSMDKTKIGYLPEERGLYDDAKVLETLVYLASLKGMPREKAQKEGTQWLERVGLSEYANQKLEKLSKGMQQKVQFIAAILHHPELVMLDEPFSGLDPLNQEFIKDTIRELQREGLTIIISAHQMNLVEELCDSLVMINKGRQVLSGKLAEIKGGYREHKVKVYHSEIENTSFLQNMPDIVIEKREQHRTIFRYSGANNINELLQNICGKITVEEIIVEKPPLHDIFIQTAKERGEDVEELEMEQY